METELSGHWETTLPPESAGYASKLMRGERYSLQLQGQTETTSSGINGVCGSLSYCTNTTLVTSVTRNRPEPKVVLVQYRQQTQNEGPRLVFVSAMEETSQNELIKALSGAFIDWSRDFKGVGEEYVIPWAYTYSRWYHQYPSYPLAVLETASKLKKYALMDRGSFLTVRSTHTALTDRLSVYKSGETRILLAPPQPCDYVELAEVFLDKLGYITSPDGGRI
ncbi:hypothetical protein FIBSPDRAFT_899207 [Athelia psychrophila]|uniref:Uncharacterized protein n=1 Tax=Athelia psychrophila TaxID=1759441 RepID=A0A165ZZF2_9AGAM|nr:hypothetical protein FIBSPDRAFT_899207 [Fibularhizoctonia sp. CBS 109695]